MPREEYVTAIEIGTDSIKACMGAMTEETVTRILGCEEISSKDCVRKGEICSSNAILDQLAEVLDRLEKSAKRDVKNVYLAVSGPHFETANVKGVIPITNASREIGDAEIAEAIRNARSWNIPPDQFWVSSNSRMFIIDEKHRVWDPRGMIGSRLESDIHVVYCDQNRLETVLRMVSSVVGENVHDIEFSALASAYGLAPEESDSRGVLVIDIGKGVTEYAVFFEHECLHSGQISVGCDHLANDLALAMHIPLDLCRELVIHNGSAVMRSDAAMRRVPIPDHRDKSRCAPEGSIHKIMELRLRELFELIRDDLETENVRNMLGGGMAIGGGGGLISGITDLAETVFKLPCRVGSPLLIPGMKEEWASPRYLTTVGLLYAAQRKNQLPDRKTPFFELVGREIAKIGQLCKRAMRF
jgi:cell division protein FtsA